MPRKRNNGLSEEKRNIIGQLVEMYDIKTAADIQEALKDLLGGTIQSMLETELSTQMQEQEEADPEYRDSRNGYKPKSLKSSMGEIPISVPQDRNSDFEPQIVPKYKRDISEIEGKVIRECEILACRAQRAQKSRRTRRFCALCGRFNRRQGGHNGSISHDRVSKMHRSCRPEYAQICCR